VKRFLAVACLAAASILSAAPRVLLVASPGESHVAQGLTALGIEYERVTPAELGKRSPFASDVVFSDRDVSRRVMDKDADLWREFVRLGGVFVGFRTSEQESWLPSPLTHDRGYETGELLAPEHPVFTTPHAIDLAALRATHGGSIYHALCALGEGWTPLIKTGAPLGWDKREERVKGPHYGMAELKNGKGRILLTELIPAYNWFHDEKGAKAAPGAKLFENIVTYAFASASEQAAKRPPAKPIEHAVRSLAGLMPPPERAPGVSMSENWTVTQRGPYTTKTDFRGVRTFLHEDKPSQAGNFIQATTTLTLPDPRAKSILLQWYESDTYCGGNERILGGEKHGQTALKNFKKGYRFKQLLVNGQVAWEADVLGRNPQPTDKRFHTVDIAPLLDRRSGEARITLRVEDRKSSGDLPFFIEAFFARVALLTDDHQRDPLLTETGAPASKHILGRRVAQMRDGSVEATGSGAAFWSVAIPKGQHQVAIQVLDSPNGTGRIRLRGPDGDLGDWELTANDGRSWWLLSKPLAGGVQRLRLDVEVGESPIRIVALALVPYRPLMGQPSGNGAGHAAKPAAVAIPLRIEETGDTARHQQVSVQTVPLPQGLLRDPDHVCLRDASGEAVPIQTRMVARWPDDSIKILQICFPVTLDAKASAAYTLEAPAKPRGKPPVALSVKEHKDSIEVDTGPVRAVLSTTHGRILDAVYRGEARLNPDAGAWDLVLQTEDGTQLHANAATVAQTQVLEHGPLRALIVRRGWFASEDGKPTRLEYRLQTEFFAGSDEVRVQSFLINRDDAPEVYLKRWSMALAWNGAQNGAVLLGDRELQAQAGAVLYQHRENQVTWTGREAFARKGGKCGGLVRLPGLALGSRWFWQRFPQAIHFAQDQLVQDFIPEPYDEQDLPTEWAKRMAERTDRYQVGGICYPQSPGKMGLFRLARGEALRQETLFRFTAERAPLPQLLADLDAPLRAHADAKYVSSTRAYGQLHPQDEAVYPAYEKSVEAFLTGYLAKRIRRREYGFENYGDDTFEWGYGPSYTYWSNSEYDHHHGFALQYLRSGEKRWWDEFEKTAREYADVVVIHHAVPGSYPQKGGPHHHNATSMWMPSDERQYWVADHTKAGAHSSHAWAEGMVDYWFLTGDPWAEEVVREMTDWYVQIVAQNRYGAGGQERGPGWALIALSALARATNDPQIFAAGQSVANWIVNWQDPVRGVVSVPISEQPSYEGGTVFMHGIVGRGLGRWYDVTGDPRVRRALLGIADWLLTEPMDQPGRFWYKQAPNCMHGYGSTSQALNAIAYAYELTDNTRYAQVADELLSHCGASARAMSWFPQVLAQLLPLRQPVMVDAGSTRSVAAPGQPATLSLSIRNTSEQPLRIVPSLHLPEGFTAPAPAAFPLDPGKVQLLSINVSCTAAGLTGTADVALAITPAGGTPEQRRLAFELRSVPQLERRRLLPGDAEIKAPMRQAGTGAQTYIDDPRPADFKGDPLAKDGTGGGHATWSIETANPAELALWAEVKWLDQKGNSFYLSVDGQPETVLGNTGSVGPWTWVKGPTLKLAAGTHTIRVRTREEGSQLGSLWLTNVPDDAPPPPRQ
jgi:hypothetical protein